MESVFFITGSSRGIGKALAEAILAADEKNWVVGLSRTNSLEHERFVFVETDLSKEVSQVAVELFKQYQPKKKIVLVNNAGTLGQAAPMGKMDNAQLEQAFQVNISAAAVLMNEFIRAYAEGPAQPLILNISSGAGKYPVDGWSAYCASKAALDMLSEVAALEAQKKGNSLKVYSLAPGVVDTAMQGEIRNTSKEDFSRVEDFRKMKEEGILASPGQVANKILILLQQPERFEGVQQDVRHF
ncbi:SDR family NAD(P)-dependent oxidoreductase [Nafulsella turpanensis]|uniref:SDR family NAD(P)-dependent oxidoreductase n=1 Tax=Nafulsella turpanensis TaxID=1265690 RepID=UPI000349D635|nr:SDR family NAD(P)-dependent oxidoreductase [Nafulsella turpanensis]